MCLPGVDPVTLGIGLALSGAGAAVSNYESNKNAENIASARSGVLRDYLDRQKKYGDEARGYLNQNINAYAPDAQGDALEKAQTARTEDITKAISAPASADSIPLSGSAPRTTCGEVAKRMLTAFDQATDRAKAAGKVGGYGDTWLGNAFGVEDAGRRIGTLNNFSKNDAALLPAEQDFAQISATRPSSMWGPILSAGGNIAAIGAGRGWNPFGTSASGVLPGGAPLG